MVLKMPTNHGQSVEHNLTKHLYAAWIPRQRAKYVGKFRLTEAQNLRHERAFSAGKLSDYRDVIIWTIEDQWLAVSHGFFLHRSGQDNMVNVISVDHDERLAPFPTYDGDAALAWLERGLFYKERHVLNDGRVIYQDLSRAAICAKALEFIEQQDKFGYSNVWEDPVIQFFSNRLTWYKVWTIERKPRQSHSRRDRQVLNTERKRIQSITKAQNWAYAMRMQHWLDIEGNPKPHTKVPPIYPKRPRGRPKRGTQMNAAWPGHTADVQVEKPAPKPRSKYKLSNIFAKLPRNSVDMDAPVTTIVDPDKIKPIWDDEPDDDPVD